MNLNELSKEKAIIKVAGEEVEVNTDASVKETLKKVLEQKGIDSFTVLVDGREIDNTNNLPETFEEHEIEVKRYVKAG